MITLYVKTNCPFSAKAIAALDAHSLTYDKKNIADDGVIEELRARGGKQQVPFISDDNMTPYLVDDDVEMYESDAIVAYIKEKYGTNFSEKSKVTIHLSEHTSMCPSEETK